MGCPAEERTRRNWAETAGETRQRGDTSPGRIKNKKKNILFYIIMSIYTVHLKVKNIIFIRSHQMSVSFVKCYIFFLDRVARAAIVLLNIQHLQLSQQGCIFYFVWQRSRLLPLKCHFSFVPMSPCECGLNPLKQIFCRLLTSTHFHQPCLYTICRRLFRKCWMKLKIRYKNTNAID